MEIIRNGENLISKKCLKKGQVMKRWAGEEKIYALQKSPSIERLDDTSHVTDKGRELRYREITEQHVKERPVVALSIHKKKGGRVRLNLPEGMAMNQGEGPGTDFPQQYRTGHFYFGLTKGPFRIDKTLQRW
jgi:hypothetical protein